MATVIFSPEAESDLAGIHDHIAADNPAAALRVINDVERRCGLIADYRLIGRSRPELAKNLRSFVSDSLIIFYRPAPGGIQVVRVIHASRDYENFEF